jgi:hypothetical protein
VTAVDHAEVGVGTTPVQRRVRRPSGTTMMAAGMLLLQLVWVFAVPPFRGSDEFDHVFKAAAVARGDWIPSPSTSTRGTGAVVDVPADLVTAAKPECWVLPYTHAKDCLGTRHGDSVRIGTGAGRYHPLFYAMVGIPALPFSGHAALYVMRIVTVLICWSLFCGALAATRRWATTSWPYAALALASTPVLLYSSSVVAPNGVEMMAAMMFWASLIGLVKGRNGSVAAPADRRLLVLAVISGATFVTTRSLGPVWCLLTALTVVLAFWPPRARREVLLHDRRTWLAAGALVTATLLSAWWILSMGSLKLSTVAQPGASLSLAERVRFVLHDLPLTELQSIAAFPYRNQATQPVVYACYVVLFVGTVVAALLAPTLRSKFSVLGTLAIAVLAPALIQVATYNTFGYVWQGRYALPYSLGIVLVAGAVLDRRGPDRVATRVSVVVLLLYATAQVAGPVDVLRNETARLRLDGSSGWLQPSPYVLFVAALLAASLLWLGATRVRPQESAP